MTAAASPGDRPLTLALVGYALLGALLMSVSARLWWQTPMVLYIPRLRRDTVYAAVEMCLVATLMYFLIVNTTNMEWYLTWLMGFAFVLPGADARALGWRLGAYFLPLVIYTVYGLRLTQLLANTALYDVLLVVAGVYLLQLLLRPRALAPA